MDCTKSPRNFRRSLSWLLSTGVMVFIFFATPELYSQYTLVNAFPDLSFQRPVDLQDPDIGSGHLFVVEQRGIIWRFRNDSAAAERTRFLDIRDRVNDAGNEEGLLGLAFHPDYGENGYFYVDYTASNPRRTVIARYQVSETNPDSALKSSEEVILEVDQPAGNHNGGQIAFGPDGYLYIAFGDGGGAGDTFENGQNRFTLLGTISRIDVDTTSDGRNYGIPPDNPLAGDTLEYREEIFAWGLRNPWRFSFDPETGELWTGDVGQDEWEEVDIIESGHNYGWPVMEGFHCFGSTVCDTVGLALPVWEYSHDVGRSITGGYVYRGSALPDLQGKYIYADYVSGRIWSLDDDDPDNVGNTELIHSDMLISSFGTDADQRLYICSFSGGIYRLDSPETAVDHEKDHLPSQIELRQNFPNPFNAETRVRYRLPEQTAVELTVYDLQGNAVSRLVNATQRKGWHSARWSGVTGSGTPANSGVYILRLKTRFGTESTKMVLVK